MMKSAKKLTCDASHFSDGYRPFRTHLDAGFATKTFVHINGIGFPFHHLENLDRTGIYTFLVAVAFVLVNIHLPHIRSPYEVV